MNMKPINFFGSSLTLVGALATTAVVAGPVTTSEVVVAIGNNRQEAETRLDLALETWVKSAQPFVDAGNITYAEPRRAVRSHEFTFRKLRQSQTERSILYFGVGIYEVDLKAPALRTEQLPIVSDTYHFGIDQGTPADLTNAAYQSYLETCAEKRNRADTKMVSWVACNTPDELPEFVNYSFEGVPNPELFQKRKGGSAVSEDRNKFAYHFANAFTRTVEGYEILSRIRLLEAQASETDDAAIKRDLLIRRNSLQRSLDENIHSGNREILAAALTKSLMKTSPGIKFEPHIDRATVHSYGTDYHR
jgi:hypothetical protein